jgi:hypothetical protein
VAEETEQLTPEEAGQIRQGYNFILRLALNDQTGSLREFWNDLQKVIADSQGDRTIIDAFVDRELPKQEYFRGLYGAQAEAAITEAQPEFATDVERAVDLKRQQIDRYVQQYGIVIPEGQADLLAREAWRSGWEGEEIFTNLRPYLESTIAGETDLIGRAGDFETDLMSWAARNGLNLSRQAAAKYITNMTVGAQSFDDVKADLRRTYLAGMFPAWADRIEAGFDPEVLFEPYRDTARRLLEVEDVGFDDPVLKTALQRVDANGRPVQMPLYQFENEIRKDPRWEFTNNAYDVYSRVGENLLRTFGFR